MNTTMSGNEPNCAAGHTDAEASIDPLSDFAPLGGSRPDAAVVACAAICLYTEGALSKEDIILPPDVLDTALAAICSPPLIVTHLPDVKGQRFFSAPTSVRLRTVDSDVLEGLKRMSKKSKVSTLGLSVYVELDASVTQLPDGFLRNWDFVRYADLRRTSLLRTGHGFLYSSCMLTSVDLPKSLTQIDDGFLSQSAKITRVDFRGTSLRTVGHRFLGECSNLTSVDLPKSLTKIGRGFLRQCTKITRIDLRETSLLTVGDFFLTQCCHLTSVELPASVTEVGVAFLNGCLKMERVDLQHTALESMRFLFGGGCSTHRTPPPHWCRF